MNAKQPKVSIGLPVYNGENYLAEAIEVVLAQTFPDFELIISDNASTDSTQAICEQYAARDARIRYHRQPVNKGAGWNFNQVFDLSSGKHFKWLAHDDRIAPDFLQKCVEPLEADPSIVLCYTKTTIIDAGGNFLEDYTVRLHTDSPVIHERFRELTLAWSLCFEVFGLIRADAIRKTGKMGNYGHGDGVLLAQLGMLGRFHEIPDSLNFSRKHAGQSMKVFGLSEQGGNDYHRYSAWFNPSLANKLIFPNWKIFKEFYRTIWLYPIGLRARIICHWIMLRWLRQHARNLLLDLAAAGRFLKRKIFA